MGGCFLNGGVVLTLLQTIVVVEICAKKQTLSIKHFYK